MGNWHINIRGIGPYHNGNEQDADRIARRIVHELRAAGHTVDDAAFTYGAHANVGADEANTADPQAAVSPAAQPMP